MKGTTPQLDFEWDPQKARTNWKKHRVTFEEAAGIFLDPHASTLFDGDHGEDEERWITLGQARTERLLVTCHTFEKLAGERFRVRIISARKATRRERRSYEDER